MPGIFDYFFVWMVVDGFVAYKTSNEEGPRRYDVSHDKALQHALDHGKPTHYPANLSPCLSCSLIFTNTKHDVKAKHRGG